MTSKGTYFKVLVIGPASAGKTSYVERLVNNTFKTDYKASIGVNFVQHSIITDGVKSVLQLWDLAGQDKFQSLTRVYYKGAHGCILLVDANEIETIQEQVNSWFRCFDETNQNIPVILLLNKADLIIDMKPIEDLMQHYEKTKQFKLMLLTSCATGQNVETSAVELNKFMIENCQKAKQDVPQSIIVNDEEVQVKKTCC